MDDNIHLVHMGTMGVYGYGERVFPSLQSEVSVFASVSCQHIVAYAGCEPWQARLVAGSLQLGQLIS